MKLTRLKGIAHDRAHHINFEIWCGSYKDLPNLETNVLEMKDKFDKDCVYFFKSRLPKSFGFNRIETLHIKVKRTMTTLKIEINIEANKKRYSYNCFSSIS